MPIANTIIYCQNCRSANTLKDSHCLECGTRLLLVVFPNSLQYDTNQVPSYYEDHLLERVSLLELRQTQLAEALRGAFEIIREQNQILREEKDLLRSLYKMFGFLKTEEAEKIKSAWDQLVEQKDADKINPQPNKNELDEIIARHESPNVDLFTKLIKESIRLAQSGEEKQSFQMFDRTLLLSSKNVPLHLYYALQLFEADKFEKTEEVLRNCLKLEPDNKKALLLSGAVNADLKNIEIARRHLSQLINEKNCARVINFIWAWLAAFEDRWTESIAAFKQAGVEVKAPELDYLIGCGYFQLGRQSMALRHLQKAVKLDEKFSDGWFMQSSVLNILQNNESAESALVKARSSRDPGAQCLEFANGKKMNAPEISLPFRHIKLKKSRIFFNGSKRLFGFFKKEVSAAYRSM